MSTLQDALDRAFPITQMGGLSNAMYPVNDDDDGEGWAVDNDDWEVISAACRLIADGEVIPKADTLELRWCTTHESQVTWWPFTDSVESRRCKWWQHSSDPSDCNIVSARLWTEEP